MGLRKDISESTAIDFFYSIIAANSLIYFSLVMSCRGLFRFLHASVPWEKRITTAGLGFLVALLSYFTYREFSVNARIIGFSCCYALVCFVTAYGLLRGDRRFARLPVKLLSLTFLNVGLFHVYRVAWTLDSSPLKEFMDGGSVHAITFLESQFIVLFVAFMVIWIATDSLERELQEIIRTDPLTGVRNRRALERFCEREFLRAMRNQNPFSLVICDIDHFKSVNDTYGHQIGDQVLIEFSNLLDSNIRDSDLVARYGGEEFVVALPETEAKQARAIAEKLRHLVMNYQIARPAETPLSVTSSFGVACLRPGDTSWSTMLKAADDALYTAKQQGRNRVVTAPAVAAG
ncbi:MAG: GGDEF domain-containing protein [Cyanobacteria bacterium P01_D01_bin.73]